MLEVVIITIFLDRQVSTMRSINVVTIEKELENEGDLVKIVENAKEYFPAEMWDQVNYLGNLSLGHDVEIAACGERFGAFLFEKLARRIQEMRSADRLSDLLLGITPNPIVAVYTFFDRGQFRREVCLVHDYVNQNVGVVSLFHVVGETSRRLIAHGLGHSKGLSHHARPVDLMFPELLKLSSLEVKGFCKDCLRKLTEDRTPA